MISQVFIIVLNMSITASIVITAVMAARLLIRWLPKIFSYCLWGVVLFRLLCPISFTAPVSLLSTVDPYTIHNDGKQSIPLYIPVYYQSTQYTDINYSAGMEASLNETGKNSVLIGKIITIGALVWILGFIIILLYSIVSIINLKTKLKTAVHDTENIYITKIIGLPFVFGFFKPVIYLPSGLREEEREYILLHEQIHITRRDYIIRSISFLALSLHWFNPFVWLAFIISGEDMEMSCDEAVIRKMGGGVKKAYASSLLSLAGENRIIYSISLGFGKGNARKRIMNVLCYRKRAVFIIGAAVVLCLTFAVIFASNPEQETVEENQSSQVFYGVVTETDINGMKKQILIIPGSGEVEIPEADIIAVRYERNENELLSGDMVCLEFPAGETGAMSNGSPSSFQSVAKYIEVLWSGCSLEYIGRNNYLFSFTSGIVPESGDIKPGDLLEISWQVLWEVTEGWEDWDSEKWREWELNKGENEPSIFYSQPILKVEGDGYQAAPTITIEISGDDLLKVFSGFGNGITFSVQKD